MVLICDTTSPRARRTRHPFLAGRAKSSVCASQPPLPCRASPPQGGRTQPGCRSAQS
ncbi:unnamed protein product [Ciceribacter selenitireducens ATCC BAA-1503]|uniref:Uncharacterized protein n=1 Tax=Ciceribacter selenitireducens ATCC BAA-1503 TaxID=1336235 RepID=A0A376AE54_9HYPH|nr:unnamed protein product [Ciceribacter selenitireducens ATCC BAA-1503]